MKSTHLAIAAFSMIACTNQHSNSTVALKDSMPCINLSKNTAVAPVVNGNKRVVDDTPELPFFKDVLNSKRLFW